MITSIDIAWLAGIYEGEGTAFIDSKRRTRVEICQKDSWILKKIQSLVGGRICRDGKLRRWQCECRLARGFLLTIFVFLSPWRRKQARVALGV